MFERFILADVLRVTLGYAYSAILKQEGSVWIAGVNSRMTRGMNKCFVMTIPSSVTAVAAGHSHIIVLKQDGSVWASGRNARGQLGDGTKAKRDIFIFAQMIPGAKAVAAGGRHSMVLTQDGDIWATGWNKYGQLGNGVKAYAVRFFVVIAGGVKAVSAGDAHSIVVMQDGSVWATGQNQNGQLGDGSREDRGTFVKVMSTPWGSYNVATDVSAGGYHSLVLKADGSVWVTGMNKDGQMGDGSTTDRVKYMQVIWDGVAAVAAGSRHSIALMQDSSVWAAGYNLFGQLGDGSTTDSAIFIPVITDGAKAVAAGAFHSMVFKEDGSVWVTGSNQHGQFGDGSTRSSNTFIRLVSSLDDGARKNAIIHMRATFACMFYFHLTVKIHASAGFFSTKTTKAFTVVTTKIETKTNGSNSVVMISVVFIRVSFTRYTR